MNDDKYLDLLNKLAKLFRAKEVLESKSDLDEFEEAVLQRIDVGAEICRDTLEALDELWEVYEERPDHRPEIKKVIEQSKAAEKSEVKKKPANSDDGLALGVGMAAGGIFDYLQSPENVEKVETAETTGIDIITDEELEALEKEAEELDITTEREDLSEALQNLTDFEQEQLKDGLEDLDIHEEVEAYEEALEDITDFEGIF